MYRKILIALDGSKYSLFGGEIALEFSEKFKSEILAVHIYDGKIHSHRLREMEPDLPEKYQEEETLRHVRESHNELIYEGFKSLSKGYIEEFGKMAAEKGIKFYLPVDVVVASHFDPKAEAKIVPVQEIPHDWMALDIGPATSLLYSEVLYDAKTIVWNGPMGVFEMDAFSRGTTAMVHSVANTYAPPPVEIYVILLVSPDL